MGTPAVTTAAASIAAIDMGRTLTQLPFWSSLAEHEMETLRRSAFVRHYEKGAFVHSSDNECLGMMFVLSGEIRTYLLSEEGRKARIVRPDTGGTALPPAPPRREDRCGSRRKGRTSFQDIRCRCCVRTHPFHNDGQRHFGAASPFRVRPRMTRTEVVSVCVPYQWQLCLPQPCLPQV